MKAREREGERKRERGREGEGERERERGDRNSLINTLMKYGFTMYIILFVPLCTCVVIGHLRMNLTMKMTGTLARLLECACP